MNTRSFFLIIGIIIVILLIVYENKLMDLEEDQ